MTAYLLTAAGVIFLTVLVGYLIPEGKLNKSVNFVLRLVCIGVLIQPVIKIFDFASVDSGEITDYDYVCKVYSDSQSIALRNKITADLDLDCTVVVNVDYIDGEIRENGVEVYGNFVEDETIEIITEYLRELGYINITVNEKGD